MFSRRLRGSMKWEELIISKDLSTGLVVMSSYMNLKMVGWESTRVSTIKTSPSFIPLNDFTGFAS